MGRTGDPLGIVKEAEIWRFWKKDLYTNKNILANETQNFLWNVEKQIPQIPARPVFNLQEEKNKSSNGGSYGADSKH